MKRTRTIRGGVASASTFAVALVATLAFSGNAVASSGVLCSPTGLEAVATDRYAYQGGETADITGSGYAPGCDLVVRITRPDSVVETATVTTDFLGGMSHQYVLPGPPNLTGVFLLEVVGSGDAVLASTEFADALAIAAYITPAYVAGSQTVTFRTLVRNTSNDTVIRQVNIDLPAGYTAASVAHTSFSSGTFVQAPTPASGYDLTFSATSGSLATSTGWARVDIAATTPALSVGAAAEWRFQACELVGCGGSGSQRASDDHAVLVNPVAPANRYTASLRDSGGNVITPLLANGVAATLRLRITSTAGSSNNAKHTTISLPGCFGTPTGVTVTGGSGYDPPIVRDGFIVLRAGSINLGSFLTVQFTSTPSGCTPGAHGFGSTVGSNQNNPPSGTDQVVARDGSDPSALFNSPPVASDDAYAVDEDHPLTSSAADGVLANDTDADGHTVTAQLVSGPANGTLTLNANGSFTYTPNVNFFGSDSFTYRASDGFATSNDATVSITVDPVNDAPSFAKGADVFVAEDSGAYGETGWATGISAGPANEAAQTLSFEITGNTNASLFSAGPAVSSNGTLTFTPAADAFGTATLTLRATDSGGTANGGVDASAPQSFTITVTAVDDAPIAVDDSATVVEDSGANPIDALANDTDIDGGPKGIESVTQGAHGSVAATGGGSGVSYTPTANYCGPDSFSYALNGGSSATVSMTISCVNDAPSAAADGASVAEDDPVGALVDVTANDSAGPASEAGQTLTITSVGTPTHGTAVVESGKIRYTPTDPNYNGPDSFSYTVSDDGQTDGVNDFRSDSATVSVTITEVNDPPVAANDSASVAEDSSTGVLVDVRANDSAGPANEAGESLTISAVGAASHGTAVVESGKIRYTPTDPDYNGSDSFSYTVTDDGTTNAVEDPKSDTSTVSITITEVNDAPVATGDSATVAEDDANGVLVDVRANDSAGPANEAGQSLTIAGVGAPSHGTAVVEGGKIRYTPTDPNYNGPDSFGYTVTDEGTTNGVDDPKADSATVSVTILTVNDPPRFTKGADQTVAEDSGAQTVPAWATNVSPGPADESGQSVEFLVSNDDNALFSAQPAVTPSGALTYTPAANAYGAATVTVRARDDGGTANGGDDTSDAQTFTITVTAVNDPPSAVADSASVDEDDANGVLLDVTANDSAGPNEVGQTLTITNVGTPSHGTAVIEGGKIRYTPTDPNYHGADSFTYTITDNGQTNGVDDFKSDSATVAVTVRPVNDAPTVAANNDSATVNEGQTATNTGTWGDVDGDDVTLTASRGTVTKNANGTWSWSEGTTDDVATTTVTITANDGNGGSAQTTFSLKVDNVPPTLTSLTPSSYLVLKGSSVTVTGTHTDPGTGDTFTCIVNWDEPAGAPQSSPGGSTSCSASQTYGVQGTYTVSMKVRDDDGGVSNTMTAIITVYDPSAGGFVTGGGWIMSPAGSYAADPTASGRANFGFNSQYRKGASTPTGETEFQLHFASFNFHSEAYEVLVVSGYKAQYRGTGKVNGVSGYKFVLTAYDGQLTGGGGVDRFRIKVTRIADGVVVYDTKMGVSEDMDLADPLAISGGSIVIHKAK